MGANKLSNIQKCGEILIDIKAKSRKNKIYIFHCAFCNLQFDQLKKFSSHIGDEHLNNLESTLKETEELEVKYEAEQEEIGIQTLVAFEGPDIKVFEDSIDERINANPDPLDTVNTNASTNKSNESLNEEVKNELQENSSSESTLRDEEVMDCATSIGDCNKEEKNVEIEKTNTDISTDSEVEDDLDDIPLKRRKTTLPKKDKKLKTTTNNEISSEESKDVDRNAEKEAKAIKKHKRCRSRWKELDDSKLPLLIEMYKKYEVLWKVDDVAFGIYIKRVEMIREMREELNAKHNFSTSTDELKNYIDFINYIFSKDKEQQLQCELNQTVFEPSTKFYKKLAFLTESQGPFKCSICNEIIKKYDLYRVHTAKHTGKSPFKCAFCEMEFARFDGYLRHVQRHLGIHKYHCGECGKGYPTKTEFDVHMRSHTGDKPYLCQICGAGLGNLHGYNEHIRRHEKRFRYECQICKSRFYHLFKLNLHMKGHLNIRDLICNLCGKGFTSPEYLQRHKRRHKANKRLALAMKKKSSP